MSKPAKLAILGNCQAQMLESMLGLAVPNIEVHRLPPVFEMNDANREQVTEVLDQADYIFCQRVSEDYHLGWVRPSAMRERFLDRLLIWPNIYFAGYSPDVRYVYLQGYGKLQGPLEDYHLGRIYDAYHAALPIPMAVQLLVSVENLVDRNTFEASLAQLIARERDTDVIISDYLAREVRVRRTFYTPNHPCNFVLAEMAERLARRAGMSFDREACEQFGYQLDRIYIPTYPTIMRAEGVAFAEADTFRGVEVGAVTPSTVELGPSRLYEAEALVRAFYKVYEVAFRTR